MALRLTGTSQAPLRRLSPSELAAQAAPILSAGDCARYSALFDRAGEYDDRFERYHAELLLVERGLTAAGSATTAHAARDIFLAVAQAAVAVLEREPREPLLLNYAAVAFYELWSLDAAQALFKAASKLDPGLPHLRRNLDEVARRLRDARGSAARRRPLHPSLPGLARRAHAVAAKAKPAQGLRLSLCMIVRDEEEMLARCLAAAAPAVDEIVIVDTGSRDRTIEIARSFGARVIEREWTGSFADARNVSFEEATGDWLLYLDADEVLVEQDAARLRALTGRVWREAFYLVETSYTGEAGDGTGMAHNALRMFRNRPHYRFEGRLHEQVAHTLPVQVPGRIEQTSVRVEHYGYLGAVRDAKEKSRRNLELLRAQQLDGPPNAFLHFNLGTEYTGIGDARSAVAEFERAWELVKLGGEQGRDYVPSLVVRLAVALRTCGRAHEAIAIADEGLAMFDGFTDLVFAKAQAQLALGCQTDAAAELERCLQMGDAPPRYGATVGAGSYLPMLALASVHRRGGDLAAARALLERCVEEHPDFVGAVGPYSQVLLASGLEAEAVVAELERRTGQLGATGRFMLASALHAAGALPAAEQQYRAVLAQRPNSSHVRVTLAEVLLDCRRYDDAAATAGAVADDDLFAALAARIELWAVIAGGRFADVAGAHARTARAGVSAAELEVFAVWAAVAQGQTPSSRVSVAGTPLLGVILETLLRHHDFDAFERLVPVLEGSALPRREQQELLAAMYLRHGFLQSAAREWMAVCDQQADARAMVGLARVAAAHGLPEDATTFAAQALALDPHSEAARALLAPSAQPVA